LQVATRFSGRHWRQRPRRFGFGTRDRPHSLHQARWADQDHASAVRISAVVDDKAHAAEAEIDDAYRRQPLLSYGYEEAIRATFIAANALLQQARSGDIDTYAAAVDTVLNALKYAVRWIWDARTLPRHIQPVGDPVQHAKPFLFLAVEYVGMVTAYLHARDDLIDLTGWDGILRISGALLQQQQYEAYNELVKTSIRDTHFDLESAIASDEEVMVAVTRAGMRSVPIDRVPVDPDVLSVSYAAVARHDSKFHMLPADWRFGEFSLEAFRAVHGVLRGIVYTWARLAPLKAREPWFVRHAAHQPFSVTRAELLAAAKLVANISKAEGRAVIDLLEYAGSGITNPDPALQPLVPTPDGRYLLSEPLVMDTAAERNLAVLLNRAPSQKAVYSRLANRKEKEMRNRICHRLGTRFRFWHGHLDGHDVTNVDLAVVDDSDQSLLLLELKWFIDPAEVRELRDRSKELSKGIDQCKTLLSLARDSRVTLNRIGNGRFQNVAAAVVSANWIGFGNIQDPEIPIINEEHLVHKLQRADTLSEVITWLRRRDYLPVLHRDYAAVERPTKVANWVLDWYRIELADAHNFISVSTGGPTHRTLYRIPRTRSST
jgi:hypothetical protein